MEKLTINGVWKERSGELLPVQFEYLNDASKIAYLEKIISKPKEERSTYENIIISRYMKGMYDFIIEIPTNDTQVLASSSFEKDLDIEIPIVNILVTFGKDYLTEYLDLFFATDNPRWKKELMFISDDEFINLAKTYTSINELTISHIKAYKKLSKP